MSRTPEYRAPRRRRRKSKRPAEADRHQQRGGNGMLVISVDLVPGGFEPLRRSIGTVQVSNVSDLNDISNYHLLAMEAANPLTGSAARTAECILFGHGRRQSVW